MRTTLLTTKRLPVKTTSIPGSLNPKNKKILLISPSTPSIRMTAKGTQRLRVGRKRYGE